MGFRIPQFNTSQSLTKVENFSGRLSPNRQKEAMINEAVSWISKLASMEYKNESSLEFLLSSPTEDFYKLFNEDYLKLPSSWNTARSTLYMMIGPMGSGKPSSCMILHYTKATMSFISIGILPVVSWTSFAPNMLESVLLLIFLRI
jgi:hypothetical protein